MDSSQASTDLDRDLAAAPASADNSLVRRRVRVVWLLAVVALLALVPAAFKAWQWYRWTRTDAYQLERILAQAPCAPGRAGGNGCGRPLDRGRGAGR